MIPARNIVPGLPAVVLRCTCRLANAVAAGSILAARQVREYVFVCENLCFILRMNLFGFSVVEYFLRIMFYQLKPLKLSVGISGCNLQLG